MKLAGLKGEPDWALEIERQLRTHNAIEFVQANPITGSVIIHYDPEALTQGEVLELLRKLGWHPTDDLAVPDSTTVLRTSGRRAAESIVKVAMETALKGLVSALV